MNSISENERKLRVGILFGGKSAEHDVSVQSARNIVEALDKEKFEPVLIGINREGRWKLHESRAAGGKLGAGLVSSDRQLELSLSGNMRLTTPSAGTSFPAPDVMFPILHGPYGEDGAIQGLLELANIPYVGAGIAGSAVGMDKDIMKRLLHDAGIPVAEYVVLRSSERHAFNPKMIIATLGLPLFVKPANMGSSIGVSKVKSEDGLVQAVELGFRYDRKVLIEKAIEGDEVECAIIGNEHPKASVLGRVIVKAGFYTYDAKYDESKDTTLEIPAKFPHELTEQAREVAIKAYKALECEGMARIDMFITKQGKVQVNEINTLPGFTKLSMYPQLWEASGLSYTDLITKLIELAIERAAMRDELLTVRADDIGEDLS